MEARFSVPEITCSACEGSIRRAVSPLDGVQAIDVDLQQKTVRVEYLPPASEALIQARIEAAGFDVLPG